MKAQAVGSKPKGCGVGFARIKVGIVAIDPFLDLLKPGMGGCFEFNRVAAAAGDQCHGDAPVMAVRHQLLGGRHRGSIRKQGTNDRLLHRQEGIRAHRFRQPCIHLSRTVESATALQLHQLGLAFQVVDDILDFTGSDQQLGKPAASDLASGYLTAPTFYALEEHPSLQPLIDRQFSEPGDLDKALEMVRASKAIERTRELAETFARESRESIAWLPESAAQRALMELPDFVLSRLY